ncbi:MAG: hypothetical protein FJ189_00545 [Gammaproteobacteria bacterium]|nr:hypothetical protein [Gammaproteobacteria bacterium]
MSTNAREPIPESLTVREFFQELQRLFPDPFDQLSRLLLPPFNLPLLPPLPPLLPLLPLLHSAPGFVGDDWAVFGAGPAVRIARRAGDIRCPRATVDIRAPHGDLESPLAELHVRYDDVARIFDDQLGNDVIPWPGRPDPKARQAAFGLLGAQARQGRFQERNQRIWKRYVALRDNPERIAILAAEFDRSRSTIHRIVKAKPTG